MPYYKVCPNCGCHLDPGEICDCKEQDGIEKTAAIAIPLASGSLALADGRRIGYGKEYPGNPLTPLPSNP